MRTVRIYKAQALAAGDPELESVQIVIDEPVPEFLPSGDRTQVSRDLFHDEALGVAAALWASLPGGTLDALIGVLLADRASLYRVPLPAPVVAAVIHAADCPGGCDCDRRQDEITKDLPT